MSIRSISTIALTLLLTLPGLGQKEGQVNIRIQKNVDGEVTIEEKTYDIDDYTDIDALLDMEGMTFGRFDMDSFPRLFEDALGDIESWFGPESGLEAFMFDNEPWPIGEEEYESAPFLGVTYDMSYAQEGARISGTVSGSVAEEMGLQEGDVITAIDGREVKDYEDLKAAISDCEVGQEIIVAYDRQGSPAASSGTLKAREKSHGAYHKLHDAFRDSEGSMQDFEEQMDDFARLWEQRMGAFDLNEHIDKEYLERLSQELSERMDALDWKGQTDRYGTFFDIADESIRLEKVDEDQLKKINKKAEPKISAKNDLELDDLRFISKGRSGRFDIGFEVPKTSELSVILYDTEGSKIYYEMLADFAGRYDKSIDLSERPAGEYYLQVLQDGRSYCRKLIKE